MRSLPKLRLLATATLFALVAVVVLVVASRGGGEEPTEAAAPRTTTEPSAAPEAALATPPRPQPTRSSKPRVDPGADLPTAARPQPTRKATQPVGESPVEPPPAEEPVEEGDALPVDSPYDLPPVIHLGVPPVETADRAAVVQAVLRSPRLALSQGARRSVRAGRASTSTLKLLLDLARQESPLLVFRARGVALRVQATSLGATRQLVRRVHGSHPDVTLGLRPVPRDYADVSQTPSDARASDIGARAAAFAVAQVGIPYSWGGGNASGATTGTCAGYSGSIRPCPATRTLGFDCSGLTLFAYAQVGVTLDHYAAFQFLEGRRIDSTQLMPGDLVFFNPKHDGPGHVGMYVGSGQFVHAPRTGDVVKISPLADYASRYMGAVRPY